MADFNFLGSRVNDSLIVIYSIKHDWTTWVGLNANIDLIPMEINLYKDHLDRNWENEEMLKSGAYKDLEWACELDWFHTDTWWRGWIPIGRGTDFSPWYLNLDTLAPYITTTDHFVFTDEIRDMMHTSIHELQEGVDALLNEHVLCSHLPAPPCYNASILDSTFPTLCDLHIEMANAKQAALDHAGWICWWMKATPDGFFAAPECIKDLLHFRLSDTYIHRGYVIDLCHDWQAIDLPFWLYYDIPVFYTWGFDERNDPKFS